MKMRSISILGLIIACGILSVTSIKCTKVGVNASQLKRAFQGIPDSTLFSSFYDVNQIAESNLPAGVNDSIVSTGVQSVINKYCGTANCHGGSIEPSLNSYNAIKSLVVSGNPEASKLWQLVTTNDLNQAMPPVNATNELSSTDKNILYNWIKNGAKQYPDLLDFRPTAVRLISTGCTSGNCHSVTTSTGAWARAGLIAGLSSSDTSMFTLVTTTRTSYYCQLNNATLRDAVWNAYKDSVKTFYADTLANASLRPYKTFGTPVVTSSVRGSLSSYDDILMDIMYPKSARSNSSVQYVDSSGNKFYAKGNYLNVSSSLLYRIDSTLVFANPYTGVYGRSDGGMAYDDGGLTPSEIAIIKAWYFADPNIADQWKYGTNNTGIFKYKSSGNIITKK